MKVPKLLFIYLAIAWPIIMFCLFNIVTDKVTITYDYGFCFDSEENLYLGKDDGINVISKDGELIRVISSRTSRGYEFTIYENNILLKTGSAFYTLDLYGEEILKTENPSEAEKKLFDKLFEYHKFTSSDGTVYKMTRLRTTVYKIGENGEKIVFYEMPAYDFVVKMLFFGCFIFSAICIPIIVVKWIKISNKSKSEY